MELIKQTYLVPTYLPDLPYLCPSYLVRSCPPASPAKMDDAKMDDAKIGWFLAYKIHKSCCLRRDCAEQQDLLFYWLYFGDRLY